LEKGPEVQVVGQHLELVVQLRHHLSVTKRKTQSAVQGLSLAAGACISYAE
jgi:hypothetical protein